ncbi:hypothetical protein KIH86_23705 [Paenibacillus sp. HN-1]|uniref:hypothetical protein n=1 Tax=Paenibacillus TaxID=44249 RepID=UPI001CA88FA1|nr:MULTISPECIES: hypothetical protein [Paenibacillus]MBY9081157.1 hypothetical protein [Paenibacillus sp. CGMCC 1.18879]MBY9087194.1 hypothetical protein [Paenibacillus sinensis]
MRAAAVVALYIAVYVWGWKKLGSQATILHRVALGCLLGWALYVNLSGLAMMPHLSISSLYIALFQPVGRAFINWLGG